MVPHLLQYPKQQEGLSLQMLIVEVDVEVQMVGEGMVAEGMHVGRNAVE